MKDKKLFITIVSIFTIISFIIGVSYAYFVPIIIGNDTASSHHTKAGTLRLNYNGTNVLSLGNASPGDSASTTFTVTNSGTLSVNNYEIYFSKLSNQFINDEVVYTLTCSSSDTNTCIGKEQTPVPKNEELALTQNSIAPNTTHTYTLTVKFISKNEPQDYNQGKELRFTMTINEMEQEPATLIARGVDADGFILATHFWEYSENITEITFESTISVPGNAFRSWDISENQDNSIMAYIIDEEVQDNSIMAYIIDDNLGNNTYHLYIQSDKEIYANPNSIGLFAGFSKLTTINNLNLLNTSNVTDMSGMFVDCSSLTSLDLSNFITNNVTDMTAMFLGCSSLTNLDISSFNTSSVTDMYGMFWGCSNLASLDLSSFDTSNVTDMFQMFYWCSSLTNLDLSTFDTSNVTNMSWMFSYCTSLTTLNLSTFDTSMVTDVWAMFSYCSSLTSLDLSSFDTSKVTSMRSMFEYCSSLASLDLSSFDTSKVTEMSDMYIGCVNLISIDLSNSIIHSGISRAGIFCDRNDNLTFIVNDPASKLLYEEWKEWQGCPT